MTSLPLLVAAIVIDSLMGEPVWLWSRIRHPVRVMGGAIDFFEKKLNNGGQKRLKGAVALLVLLAGFSAAAWGVARLPGGFVIEVLMAAILLGHRSLTEHVLAVAAGLDAGLPEARQAVAMIVGRETAALDQSAVARAAIESAAENFSDGVVAPVFWFALLGLPGIVAYKLVNTADSMIGHRSEKYLEFGWAAARLDDVLNYIPARLAAGLIVLASGTGKALAVIRADAGQHRSPNAGWPEAAMAGALDVALSGPRVYDGKRTNDSFVNAGGRKALAAADIRASVRILWQSWAVMLGVIVILVGVSLL